MTTTGAALAHWTDRLPPPPAVGPVEAEPSTPSVKVPRQTDAPADGCPGRRMPRQRCRSARAHMQSRPAARRARRFLVVSVNNSERPGRLGGARRSCHCADPDS